MKAPRPRGDMSGWDEYTGNVYVPNNAAQLTGGHFILSDQFGQLGTQEVKPVDYSWSSPVRNTFVSPTAKEEGRSNYGYAALYHNKTLNSKLRNVAESLEIPGQWLADTLAMTSQGSFDPKHVQAPGVYGIASQEVKRLSKPYDYLTGDAARQLDTVHELLKETPSEVLKKGPEFVLTALTLGRNRAEEVASSPRKALKLSNGVYTLNDVFDALGGHAGRSYDHVNNDIRRQRNSAVHDTHRDNCRWCHALANSGSAIVPHQHQEI